MAVTESGGANSGTNTSAGQDGGVSQEETDAAGACHSFGEVVGTEAGAKGE